MRNKKIKLCFIINILSLISCFILKKNGFIVSIFSLINITVIYIKNTNNIQKYLYYTCLFFAIVTLGHKINYYVAFSMYVGVYLYNNFNRIKKIITQKKQRIDIIKNLNKYKVFLIIFFVYSLLSLIWSININDAIEYLSRYIIGITLLIMVVTENKSKGELQGTFKLLLYIIIGVLCIGTAEILGIDFGLPNHYEENSYNEYKILDKEVTRVPVTFFNNPNDNAYFLVIGLAVVFCSIFSSKSKKNVILNYMILILISINLVFSRSRMGIYGGCIYMILVIALGNLNFKRNRKFAYKSIGHSILSLIIIVGVLNGCSMIPKLHFYTDKFTKINFYNISNVIEAVINSKKNSNSLLQLPTNTKDIKTIIGEPGSNNVRITLIYDVAVKGLIEDKNLFGVGVGNSPNFIKEIANTNGFLNVHCMWFEILCDFGLGIFIYLIYIYFSLIYDVIRKKDKNEFYVFASGMCCVNVLLVFGPSSVIHFAPFWILMGLIYAYSSMKGDIYE